MKSRALIILAAVAALSGGYAYADTNWQTVAVDGNWNNVANWTAGVPNTGNIAIFTTSNITTTAHNGDKFIKGITFSGGDAFTINGGGGVLYVYDSGIEVLGGSNNQVVNAQVRPRGTVFSAINNGTGKLDFNGDMLVHLPSAGTIVGTFGGSGDIELKNLYRRNTTNEMNLVKEGAGALTILNAYTAAGNAGSSGYLTGTATINGGTISINNEANLGGNPAAFNAAHLTLDGGALRATASFNLDDSNRGITLGAGNGTFNVDAGRELGIPNVIAGPGGLVKQGGGILTLTPDNTYTGGTTVKAGTLKLGGTSDNVGTIRNTLTVESGATVDYTAENTFGWSGGVSVNVLNIDGGTVGGANYRNHFWNNFQLNMTGGTLNLGGTNNEFHNATITANNASTTAQILPVTASAVMRLRDNTSVKFDIADGSQAVDMLVTARVAQQGSSNLTKVGYGTLALSNNSVTIQHLNVANGALDLTNATVTANTGTTVADRFATNVNPINAVLNINAGTTLTTQYIVAGNGGGSNINGTINQYAGSSVATTGATAENNGIRLGHFPGADITYNLMGGTLTIGDNRDLSCGTDGTGHFHQTDGILNVQRIVVNKRTNDLGDGTLTLEGGTANIGSGGIITDEPDLSKTHVNYGGQGATIKATANFSSPLDATLSGTGANAVTFDTNGNNIGLSGTLSGTGGLKKSGNGTLTLSQRNTYDGDTTVNGGKLVLAAPNSSASTIGAGKLVINTGATVDSGVNGFGHSDPKNPVEIYGGTLNQLSADSHMNTITMQAGAMGGAGEFRLHEDVTVLASATSSTIGTANLGIWESMKFDVADGGAAVDLDVSSRLTGSGTLTKDGPGTMAINGSNSSFNGNVVVDDGTLLFNGAANSHPIGSTSARTITINPGAVLTAAVETHNPFGTGNQPAKVIIDHGTMNTAKYQHTQDIEMTGGIIQPTGAEVDGLDMQGSPTVTINASTGGSTIASKMKLGSTVTFDVADGIADTDLLVSGQLYSNNGLIKDGDGTMLVSANNTYAGTTLISDGTLLVTGNHTGGGTYTVGSGGTLGGTGDISALIVVEDGGTLSPGLSIDRIDLGALDMKVNSTLLIEIDALTNFDFVDVTGTAHLDGKVEVVFQNGFAPSIGDTFDVLAAGGGITFTPGYGVLSDASAGSGVEFSSQIVNNGTTLRLQFVPEPSTLLIWTLLAGLGLGVARRRRRK